MAVAINDKLNSDTIKTLTPDSYTESTNFTRVKPELLKELREQATAFRLSSNIIDKINAASTAASAAPSVKPNSKRKNGETQVVNADSSSAASTAASSGTTVSVVSKGEGPSTNLSSIGSKNKVFVVPAKGGRRKRTKRAKRTKRSKRTRRHR
jgi:hypothetical protein